MKSSIMFILFITLVALFIGIPGTITFASPTLSVNSKGADVAILQERLYSIGYTITTIDGEFGPETEAAVEAFQRDHDITVTGIVNNATWRALQKAKPIKSSSKIKAEPPINSLGGAPNDKVSGEFTDNRLVPFGKILINKKQANAVLETGKRLIGVPYVFGGTTPSGFDCSGFLQYIFKENGILIPRLADEQYKLGKLVKTSELDAGDLVFFTTYEAGASHCGIYIGGGQFLHTSSSRGVRIDNLDNVYWAPKFYGAKKIVEI